MFVKITLNHLNWSETQTPMRKLASAQRKAARVARGKEEKVARREELKKKAIWENTRESQTPKKAPDLKLRASTM